MVSVLAVTAGLAAGFAGLLVETVFGQTGAQTAATTAAGSAKAWTPPRVPGGDPDLEGVWNYGTATPLERAAQFAGKAVLTEAEAAAWEKDNAERRGGNTAVTAGPDWWEPQNGTLKNRRTSLIVDPPDGRLPPAAASAGGRGGRGGGRAASNWENPEELGLQDRCIAWPAAAPPYTPTVYNNNIGIIETKDYVVLQSEMIHVARIVRMNGTHGTMTSMYGDSIGHWEGGTLVVDTINFDGRINYRNTGDHLHLIERFTRTADNALEYRFTVDDPKTWSRPWTAQVDMTKIDDRIYEFACHEGNSISVIGTLQGARMAEQAAGRK